MARLKKPKKILRLGGDFLWERYTDRGGRQSLREWYRTRSLLRFPQRLWMASILRSFDALLFSTKMQHDLYAARYRSLPRFVVVENALPGGTPVRHERGEALRLLFMGRFVGFKNLFLLLEAVRDFPGVSLTLVGEGPLSIPLVRYSSDLSLNDRVTFLSPMRGEEKDALIDRHDALILPSVTELSPNAALEARRRGLPVLLTRETGLGDASKKGMIVADMTSKDAIVAAMSDLTHRYPEIAAQAALPVIERSWSHVCDDHLALFSSLLAR